MGKWICHFIVIVWLMPQLMLASDLTFQASAPNLVKVGEQFALTYSVNANPSQFQPPSMEGFRVRSGPNQSRSSSMQYVNGQMTRSTTISFVYYVQAIQEGKFQIPAAKITVDGKEYASNTLDIEVIGAGATQPSTGTPAQQTQQPQQQPQQQGAQEQASENLFVRVLINKNEVYVGEPLVATVKVYTRVNLAGIHSYQSPAFNGFAKTDIEVPPLQFERENVGGEIYHTGVYNQTLLIPQQTGELLIDPVKMEFRVREEVQRSFWGSFREHRVPIESRPVKVRVKPLPGTRPSTFSGGVGTFDVKAQINKKEVKVNEPLDLKVSVSGRGNLRYLRLPEVSFPSDFEVYDPDIKNAFRNTASGQAGNKIYEYLIIPRHPGNFVIPAIPLTYFDLEKQRYVTKETAPISIQVTGDRLAGGERMLVGADRQQLQHLGDDIRFIKLEGVAAKKTLFFLIEKWYYWLLYVVLVGLLAYYLFMRQKLLQEAGNRALTRNKKANQYVRKRLKTVRKYLNEQREELFYEEISKALWGYMADRLMIPVAELSREKVESVLVSKQVEMDAIKGYFDLLDTCEYARYAPAKEAHSNNMNELYDRVVAMIALYEHKI